MSLEIDTSRRGTLCLSEIINVVLYFCLFFFIPSVFAYFNPLIITCSKAKVIWRASRTQEITSFPVAPQSFWTTATKSIAKWLSCPTTFECPAGPQVLDQVSLKDLIFEIKYVSLFFLLFSSYWYLLCKSGVVKCFLAHSLYTSGSENDCCALPSAQSLFVSQSNPAILLLWYTLEEIGCLPWCLLIRQWQWMLLCLFSLLLLLRSSFNQGIENGPTSFGAQSDQRKERSRTHRGNNHRRHVIHQISLYLFRRIKSNAVRLPLPGNGRPSL